MVERRCRPRARTMRRFARARAPSSSRSARCCCFARVAQRPQSRSSAASAADSTPSRRASAARFAAAATSTSDTSRAAEINAAARSVRSAAHARIVRASSRGAIEVGACAVAGRAQELPAAQAGRREIQHAVELRRRRRERPRVAGGGRRRQRRRARARAGHRETRAGCCRDRHAARDRAPRPRLERVGEQRFFGTREQSPRPRPKRRCARSCVRRRQREHREVMIERVVAGGLGEPAFLARELGLCAVVGDPLLRACGAGMRRRGAVSGRLRRDGLRRRRSASHHPSRLADDRDARATRRQLAPAAAGQRHFRIGSLHAATTRARRRSRVPREAAGGAQSPTRSTNA